MGADALPPRPTRLRLACQAPHPDRRRTGDPCGAPLGAVEYAVAFDTTAVRLPEHALGTWIRCARCRAWNRFVRVGDGDDAPAGGKGVP